MVACHVRTRGCQVPSCPPRVGLVQGWESICWGVGGFLQLKIIKIKSWLAYWFIGVVVSPCLGFSVSSLWGLKVSELRSFKKHVIIFRRSNSYSQIPIACVLEDIDPILPNFHFMFSIDVDPIFKISQECHSMFLIDIDPVFKISGRKH